MGLKHGVDGWRMGAKVFMRATPYDYGTSATREHGEKMTKAMEAFFKGIGDQVPKQIDGELPFAGESAAAFAIRHEKWKRSKMPALQEKTVVKSLKIFRWMLLALWITYIPFMTGVANGVGYSETESTQAGVLWPAWILWEIGRFVGELIT